MTYTHLFYNILQLCQNNLETVHSIFTPWLRPQASLAFFFSTNEALNYKLVLL